MCGDTIAMLLQGMRQMQEEPRVVGQVSQHYALGELLFQEKWQRVQFNVNQQVIDRPAVVASCLDCGGDEYVCEGLSFPVTSCLYGEDIGSAIVIFCIELYRC